MFPAVAFKADSRFSIWCEGAMGTLGTGRGLVATYGTGETIGTSICHIETEGTSETTVARVGSLSRVLAPAAVFTLCGSSFIGVLSIITRAASCLPDVSCALSTVAELAGIPGVSILVLSRLTQGAGTPGSHRAVRARSALRANFALLRFCVLPRPAIRARGRSCKCVFPRRACVARCTL